MRTFAARLFILLTSACTTAWAHVPYLERSDLDPRRPFRVADAEQSIAVYGWLETATDVDVFAFSVTDPANLFLELIVPVCPGYEAFLPWYALVGPGLPPPDHDLPVALPPGYGAIVVPNLAPGEPRQGPFGGREPGSGSQAQIVDDLKAILDAGFESVIIRYRGDSAAEQTEQMDRFAGDILPKL